MEQSFVFVMKTVPYGLILSISSSTSWNHAPGAMSSAISTTVTLLPCSLRNSVVSSPVMPEPITTTLLFFMEAFPSSRSGAAMTFSLSVPGMERGLRGVPPVAQMTAYGSFALISSAVSSRPGNTLAPSFFAAVIRSSMAQYSLSLWLPDDAAMTCPPAFSDLSYSSTSNPLMAMVFAAVSPAGPAPMTITLRPCPSSGML